MNEYQMWRAAKPRSDKERKDKRYSMNMKVLRGSGFSYEILSICHLRIANAIDFWPTTGRWKVVKEKRAHHGGTESIHQALAKLKEIKK